MITGRFRDGHPRVSVTLPGTDAPVTVDFILDTGYEGDLTVPGSIAALLLGQPGGFRRSQLADGSIVASPYFVMTLEDEDTGERRVVEVLVLPGNPLMGTTYLAGYLLEIELVEGGQVSAETLR